MKLIKDIEKIEQQKIKYEPTSILTDMSEKPVKELPENIQSAIVLMDDNFKRRKTVLTNHQVSLITTLDVLSQLYDIAFLKNWVNNYAEWRTSGDKGRGRQDITDIFKFSSLHEQNRTKELFDMLGRSR